MNELRTALTLLPLLAACQHPNPMRTALDRGDLVAACRETFHGDKALVDELDQRVFGDPGLKVSVTTVPIAELRSWAPGGEALEISDGPWLVRVRWEYPGRTPHSFRLRPLELHFPSDGLRIYPGESELAVRGSIPEVRKPDLEAIPPEYLPRQFVEQTAPDRWEYRPKHDLTSTMLMMATGGLSLFVPGMQPRTELVERPAETAAQKKQRERRNKKEQAAFEKAERERSAAAQAAAEATVARNQAALVDWQARVDARKKFVEALLARAKPTCLVGEELVLAPGGSCEFLKSVSFGVDRGVAVPFMEGTVEAAIGPTCNRSTKWAIPLPGVQRDEWAAGLQAQFGDGGVTLKPGPESEFGVAVLGP